MYGMRVAGFCYALSLGNYVCITVSVQRCESGVWKRSSGTRSVGTIFREEQPMYGQMNGRCVVCFITREVRALREHQQLHGLSDVAEVVQHVGHVRLVVLPTTLDEDEAGHLHRPAWKTHSLSLTMFISSVYCSV